MSQAIMQRQTTKGPSAWEVTLANTKLWLKSPTPYLNALGLVAFVLFWYLTTEYFQPVSYTHLDVYKRQVVPSGIDGNEKRAGKRIKIFFSQKIGDFRRCGKNTACKVLLLALGNT